MQKTYLGRIANIALASSSLAILAAVTAPAQAQDQQNMQVAQAGASSGQIETVMVTARRREENIQTTPVSVTSISGDQLESRAAISLQDVRQLAPNVVIDPVSAGPNAAAISIRGISFEDIEKSFDPAVGVLIDGIYMGTNTGQLAHAFDYESVEVLRGPQGTLFGRNTTGGVINVRRTRPTGEMGINAQVTIGDYGRRNYHAVVNLPTFGGVVATKLFYARDESDGYFYNATKKRHEPQDTYQDFGGSFLFTPSSNFDFLLTYEHIRDRGEAFESSISSTASDLICLAAPIGPGGALVNLTGIPANECNRSNGKDLYTSFSNRSNAYSYDVNAVTGEAHWRLNGVTLTSVTGYIKSKENMNQDFDASSIDFFYTDRRQPYKQFTQELRAAGNIGDTIDYVVGGYYFHSTYSLNQITNFGPFLQAGAGLPAVLQALAGQSSTSYAVFGDVDWRFMPRWRLSVGGRYTWDRKSAHNLNQIPLGGGAAFPIFNVPNAKDKWSAFTPKVSLDYRPTDNAMLYGSYSQGYRAGGFNGRAGDAISAATAYNPEKVKAYEVGAKTEWLNQRLQLNAAVFMTKFDNKQEEVVQSTGLPPPANPQETIVANVASATIRGVELEILAVPTDGLTLRGQLGLLDAGYDHFYGCDPLIPVCIPGVAPTGNQLDLKNRTMRRAPHTTMTLGFDYAMPSQIGDWVLSASYNYVSKYQTIVTPAVNNIFDNDPRGLTDDQNNVDASLTWSREAGGGQMHVTVFGRNLLNDRGLGGALVVGTDGRGTPDLFSFAGGRAPRTFGVTLGFKY